MQARSVEQMMHVTIGMYTAAHSEDWHGDSCSEARGIELRPMIADDRRIDVKIMNIAGSWIYIVGNRNNK